MWAGCNTFDFVWTLLSGSVWTIEHLFRKHKSKMIEKFGNVGLGLNRLDTTSNIWRKTRTRTFRPGRTGLHRAIAGKNISCEFICTDQSRGKAGFMFSILTLRISTIKFCSFLLPIPVSCFSANPVSWNVWVKALVCWIVFLRETYLGTILLNPYSMFPGFMLFIVGALLWLRGRGSTLKQNVLLCEFWDEFDNLRDA